jgi:ABC-type branched-subunit amino acid transport system substrate-binding protein
MQLRPEPLRIGTPYTNRKRFPPAREVGESSEGGDGMERRTRRGTVLLAGALALVATLTVAAVAVAGPSSKSTARVVSPQCKTGGVGFASVLSGPAAALGQDQFHWAKVFLLYWNTNKPIVGLPKGFKRTPIKIRAVGDSQLNPQVAATVGGQMLSNKQVLAMMGFVGSNESLGGGPVLDRGGMAYISSSATRDDVATKLKNFYRVVPNNLAQAQLAVGYLLKQGLIKSGQQAMVVDDAEAYAANLADDGQKLLEAGGLKAVRESLPASSGSATANFSALANKAVAINADIVYAPTQVASDSQLFAQQLKSAGYKGLFVGADGSFDPTNFKFPGAYLSYFGADVHSVAVAKPYLATFTKLYGQTLGFGPPTFTAMEMLAIAISQTCADGKTSRAEVLKTVPKVKITNSILGVPIAFDNAGDLFHGPKKGVTLFQIQPDGSYKLVSRS